jgi:hypothetical protein
MADPGWFGFGTELGAFQASRWGAKMPPQISALFRLEDFYPFMVGQKGMARFWKNNPTGQAAATKGGQGRPPHQHRLIFLWGRDPY